MPDEELKPSCVVVLFVCHFDGRDIESLRVEMAVDTVCVGVVRGTGPRLVEKLRNQRRAQDQ